MSLNSQVLLEQQFGIAENKLPRDLGEGLVLRAATPADAEPLAQFNGRVHGRDHFDEPIATYTRDFMRESHPTIGPSNVLIVEDTRAGKIVSSTILIPQTWTYAGIPFGVGRPEMVGTDPEYRRRGLVRAQFDAQHAMSAAMGHLVQGVTGIPWYYRQFGYEYALDLGGGRITYFSNVPMQKEGESEPYRLRALALDDLPFVAPLYDRECARSLVACPRPEWLWRHLLTGNSPASFEHRPFQIIETTDGRAVGYVAPSQELWDTMYVITELAVVEGQSLRAVMPTLLRALKAMGEAEAAQQKKTVNALVFSFGREHPAFTTAPDLLPKERLPYGWYIRVADVPAFLRHIAPALTARLARSPLTGHSGELKIGEYRGGLRLVFENGRIATAEPWLPTDKDRGDAAFPPLVFLQLLFGRKSLAELRAAYPDVWAKDDAAALLDALFPKMYSCVVPVG
jgi:predicted N-acetyltransferase YhbS